jgi:hypothetical protein
MNRRVEILPTQKYDESPPGCIWRALDLLLLLALVIGWGVLVWTVWVGPWLEPASGVG